MAGAAAIAARGISRARIQADGSSRVILDRVDLDIRRGVVTALIGPSGAGKSTILRLLNRLEDADAGEFQLDGKSFEDYSPLEIRRRIGLVIQKPFMFPGTVRDNLEYAYRSRGEDLPDGKLPAVLDACSVDPGWLDQPARKLSVGQQQRVSLARTLLNAPEILLLDEPTSSLDPQTAEAVLSRLADWIKTENIGLVLVTHDHRLASRYADYLLELRDGRIVEKRNGDDDAAD